MGPLIHFGVAQKREYVELERYARRENIEVEDVVLNLGNSNPVYESGFPLHSILTKLNQLESRWDFRESQDAGSFVCNALYYFSLRDNVERLFIHVPMMDKGEAIALGSLIGNFFA